MFRPEQNDERARLKQGEGFIEHDVTHHDSVEKRCNMYADRLDEFQYVKEELACTSYREFIETNVYNINAAITATKTKHELFKDIEFLDTIRRNDDPNKPYVHEPFRPFDEELNDITFSCPICADEFCVHDVDTENLPVSVYGMCNHVACNRCIELMRKKYTLNPYHCPWCRQASCAITPINDALLRQTVLFCEYALRLKKDVMEIDKKKANIKYVKKMKNQMEETLSELNSTLTNENTFSPDAMSNKSRIQKKKAKRYAKKLHTDYMNLKEKYTKTIAEATELQNKKDQEQKRMKLDIRDRWYYIKYNKVLRLKVRIMSDFNNKSL